MKSLILIVLIFVSLSYSRKMITPFVSIGANYSYLQNNNTIGPSLEAGIFINEKHRINLNSILLIGKRGDSDMAGWGAGYHYNVLNKHESLNLFLGGSIGAWAISESSVSTLDDDDDIAVKDGVSIFYFENFAELSGRFEVGRRRLKYFFTEKVFLGKEITNNAETGISFYFNKAKS